MRPVSAASISDLSHSYLEKAVAIHTTNMNVLREANSEGRKGPYLPRSIFFQETKCLFDK
jgi:hypothetical protein